MKELMLAGNRKVVFEPGKRKGCLRCGNYSRQLSRCKLGKINPKTVKGGIEAMRWCGIGYICDFDGMQYKVIKAMTPKKEML